MNPETEDRFVPRVGALKVDDLKNVSFNSGSDIIKEGAEELVREDANIAKLIGGETLESVADDAAAFIQKALGGGVEDEDALKTTGQRLAELPKAVNAALVDLSVHSFGNVGMALAAAAIQDAAHRIDFRSRDTEQEDQKDDLAQREKEGRAREIMEMWRDPALTARGAREIRRDAASRAMDVSEEATQERRGKRFSLQIRRGQKRYGTAA